MPRPVWSGAVSFGLVTIPIKVLPATENHNVSFHQVHLEDGGRIRYQKVCEIDGQVLDQGDIGRGYEIAKDQIVPVTDAELDQMPLPTAKAIEIVAFVPASSIDPIQIGDSYYLAADGQVAAKPYRLLQQALKRSDRVAIAKFAWHNRERLGMLQVLGDVIALHSMRWPDEIRSPETLSPDAVDLGDIEVDRALSLMDAMTTSMDEVRRMRDEYRHAVEELLAAKAEHREPQPVAGETEKPGEVVDLMAALNASVEQARASREAGGGEPGTVHEMPKRTAKKAPAKKTAAKKTTSGKKPAAPKRRKAG